jgi:hypothetical protein
VTAAREFAFNLPGFLEQGDIGESR